MKIVTIKGLWLFHWRTKFHIDISSHTHTRSHTHTSGRHLKITFLDVLDYSKYSETNISKKKIFEEAKSLNRLHWRGLWILIKFFFTTYLSLSLCRKFGIFQLIIIKIKMQKMVLEESKIFFIQTAIDLVSNRLVWSS